MWQALHAEVMREFWQPEPWGVLVEAVRLARKEAVRRHSATRSRKKTDRVAKDAARYKARKAAGLTSEVVAPHLPLTQAQKCKIVVMYKSGRKTWDIASAVGSTDAVVREYLRASGRLRASDV